MFSSVVCYFIITIAQSKVQFVNMMSDKRLLSPEIYYLKFFSGGVE